MNAFRFHSTWPCVALVCLGTIAAPAAIPSESGTITACYTKQQGLLSPKGSLRTVDAASQCYSHETALTWNQQGQAGPPGPAGAQGAPGALGYELVQSEHIVIGAGGTYYTYCPEGKTAIGAGFFLDRGVIITAFKRHHLSPSTWEATAHDTGSDGGRLDITVTCVAASD
jgi:hypothetical protein